MALADPSNIVLNNGTTNVTHPLNRIESQGLSSTYSSSDESLKLVISHQSVGKTNAQRTRRLIKFSREKIAADPLTSEQDYESASVSVVIDEPKVGFSDAELWYLVDALKGFLTQTTTEKILSSQS